MKIYLVRHAETHANVDPSKPATLTDMGRAQLEKISSLRSMKFDRVFSSDLERALLTAQSFSEPIVTDELREIFRVIVGGPDKPSRPSRFEEDKERADKFYRKMLSWDDSFVAVVAHGNIIRYFLALAQNLDPASMWSVKIEPGSLSILEIQGGKVVSVSQNLTEHLDDLRSTAEEFAE